MADSTVLSDFSKQQTVVQNDQPPPPYGLQYPIPSNNPYTIQYQPPMNNKFPVTMINDPTVMNIDRNKIKNYQVWTVVNILCCGLVAAYYSSETDDRKSKGGLKGALIASKRTRNINILATLSGLIILRFVTFT